MYNYFIDKAINDVNCSLYQDKQYVLKGKHICRVDGVLNRLEILGRSLTLPTQGQYYHVYQIGRLHPKQLGLIAPDPKWLYESWTKISDTINSNNIFVNVYNDAGVEIPKYYSYYIFTKEGDLLLAIPTDSNLDIDYVNDVYLRVYTNAYYQSVRADIGVEDTIYQGRSIENTQEILDLQVEYENYTALGGHVYAYVNGYKVPAINLLTVALNDSVEFLYDSSVKAVVYLTIDELQPYVSILDNRNKYLVHYPDPTPNSTDSDIIDFQDDVDIHLVYDGSSVGNNYGVYYHRNSIDSMRMVTHRDYSVPVDYVINTAQSLIADKYAGLIPISEVKLELKIRDSGFDRRLVYDNSRIFELYKLNDAEIMQAMLGINSVLSIWRAENLEANGYTELMRSYLRDIDIDLVQEAYGYNSLSRLGGDTPNRLDREIGVRTATLPYLLTASSTVFEYDSDGYLLGYRLHSNSEKHIVANEAIGYVETIYGRGTDKPDSIFGIDNITLPDTEYRVYRSFINEGVSNEQWEDITGSNLYTVVDGVLVWSGLEFNQYLMVRDDSTFLLQELNINTVEGNLFFTLAELAERSYSTNESSEEGGEGEESGSGEGEESGEESSETVTEQLYSMPVPMAQLDIWLNGKSLIEGLDYKVVFPMVYILNKKYLVQPAGTEEQHILVRFTGFCDSNLQIDPVEDLGWIEHGFLSNNNRHDVRDDKVLRITVDGKYQSRDDIVYSEQHQGISISNAINGLPYQIKDIIVPLHLLVNRDTYEYRAESMVTDGLVSDYMTDKLPQPDRNGLSVIAGRYPLVSPFIATIISHLIADLIPIVDIDTLTNDTKVMEYLSNYEELLVFDPIAPANVLNQYYTVIHPTNMNTSLDMPIAKYDFLTKVVRIYGNDLIELTNFITVTN